MARPVVDTRQDCGSVWTGLDILSTCVEVEGIEGLSILSTYIKIEEVENLSNSILLSYEKDNRMGTLSKKLLNI